MGSTKTNEKEFLLDRDWSMMDSNVKKVIVNGRINKIYDPTKSAVKPFSNCFTATLYPRKGRVFYLKFRTEAELKKQSFAENEKVVVEGNLRLIDGKQILTDMKKV